MRTYQRDRRASKQRLRAFNHAGFTAEAIAFREDDADGAAERRSGSAFKRQDDPPHIEPARCIAYREDGDGSGICGAPASFLDLDRGGFVCAAHRPERRVS
jgi:hypothetical protein